jgi:hypothetical protein
MFHLTFLKMASKLKMALPSDAILHCLSHTLDIFKNFDILRSEFFDYLDNFDISRVHFGKGIILINSKSSGRTIKSTYKTFEAQKAVKPLLAHCKAE